MNTKEILAEMLLLPIEQSAMLADTLLKSLNTIDAKIDNEWLNLAKARYEEINSGRVNTVNGENVFNEIWKKFSE
jgi:hypothetical protein